MRIIAGAHRGLTLASVGKGDRAAQLRPTSDRVRESLFSVLMGHDLPDPRTRVLDLFAGTGALGLEAVSRGAAFACFVDNGRAAQRLIRENIAKARRQSDTSILARNATGLPPNDGAPFDLVFLDPPYGRGLGAPALASALSGGWISPGALVVWEEAAPQMPPQDFALRDCRRYGDTHVTVLERVDSG